MSTDSPNKRSNVASFSMEIHTLTRLPKLPTRCRSWQIFYSFAFVSLLNAAHWSWSWSCMLMKRQFQMFFVKFAIRWHFSVKAKWLSSNNFEPVSTNNDFRMAFKPIHFPCEVLKWWNFIGFWCESFHENMIKFQPFARLKFNYEPNSIGQTIASFARSFC